MAIIKIKWNEFKKYTYYFDKICQRKVYAYQDKIKRINHMKQLQ